MELHWSLRVFIIENVFTTLDGPGQDVKGRDVQGRGVRCVRGKGVQGKGVQGWGGVQDR